MNDSIGATKLSDKSVDANHRLDSSVRFVCSRHLYKRLRTAAKEVKRRTISEFVRQIIEEYLEAKESRERTPGF